MAKSKRAKKARADEPAPLPRVSLPVIDAEAFEEARRNPAVKSFLRNALVEEERLEREGLIHP